MALPLKYQLKEPTHVSYDSNSFLTIGKVLVDLNLFTERMKVSMQFIKKMYVYVIIVKL